ncbi:hypothetical protein SAMN04488564_10211 [Lentzea waywayandensis]|uniref:Uncharacterized protein n=1 Tax=Lentzea waywayandensis TaxID=84724 RepID=A0A1I6D8Y5_9PSEU|nr:hypothetical protein [Lentzea waywayandensis]SFR01893.1 hypothetical protein SAMN04488564_10211 [Lentzea waywayandensis]
MPRPRLVTASTYLWLVAVIVELAVVAVAFGGVRTDLAAEVATRGVDQSTQDAVVLAGLGVLLGPGVLVALVQLGVLQSYRVGRNWARILLAVLGVVGALVSPMPLVAGIALAGAGVLMFLPVSNAWFAGRRP